MSSNLDGFQNECDLINYLNGKQYKDLNENMKSFIKFMYPNINDIDIINAIPGKSGQKPDIEIIINQQSKMISVKKGSGNSVHQENVDLFMDFLTSLNVDINVKIELLKYHWSDGSTDGSGKIRVSSSEYKRANQRQIELINKELNEPNILRKIVNRILFQGKNNNYDRAEYIYHGNVNNGKWASDKEVFQYIENNEFDINSVHFGPLTYQIWNSCLNHNPRTENRRNVMQSKWGSLMIDLINIERDRNNNE